MQLRSHESRCPIGSFTFTDRISSTTMAMKRRRSVDLADLPPTKRLAQIKPSTPSASCPLIFILRQYGLLDMIVSALHPDDLLALALTSKAIYQALFPCPSSLENLLGRLECSGTGIQIRQKWHKKSRFFYDYQCTEHVQCGSANKSRTIESKPCVTCKVTTCNECRIHCVYQSIYETPNDFSELPNFSGFVMLASSEHAILSPHHLNAVLPKDAQRWRNPATDPTGPYHDQGYLDAALEFDEAGPPENIQDVLDIDLGQHSLTAVGGDSRYLSVPPNILRTFTRTIEDRKLHLCKSCFEREAPKGPAGIRPAITPLPGLHNTQGAIKPCTCTLRKRFLDRWLCLRCYEREEKIIAEYWASSTVGRWHCRCCGLGESNESHEMCLWCWGEIKEDEEVSDDEDGSSRSVTEASRSTSTSTSVSPLP